MYVPIANSSMLAFSKSFLAITPCLIFASDFSL